MKKYVCLIALLTCLTNCASIVSGANQSLSVDTPSAAGAACTLVNNKGTWHVPMTPGSTTVHRSYKDLNVTCKKEGYENSVLAVKSSTKGMAFGNVLLGGVIGAGVDVGTGAAYDYPPVITLPMEKTKKVASR